MSDIREKSAAADHERAQADLVGKNLAAAKAKRAEIVAQQDEKVAEAQRLADEHEDRARRAEEARDEALSSAVAPAGSGAAFDAAVRTDDGQEG